MIKKLLLGVVVSFLSISQIYAENTDTISKKLIDEKKANGEFIFSLVGDIKCNFQNGYFLNNYDNNKYFEIENYNSASWVLGIGYSAPNFGNLQFSTSIISFIKNDSLNQESRFTQYPIIKDGSTKLTYLGTGENKTYLELMNSGYTKKIKIKDKIWYKKKILDKDEYHFNEYSAYIRMGIAVKDNYEKDDQIIYGISYHNGENLFFERDTKILDETNYNSYGFFAGITNIKSSNDILKGRFLLDVSNGKYTKNITYIENREFLKYNMEANTLIDSNRGFSFGIDSKIEIFSQTNTTKKYTTGLVTLGVTSMALYKLMTDKTLGSQVKSFNLIGVAGVSILLNLAILLSGRQMKNNSDYNYKNSDAYSNKIYSGFTLSYKY